MYEIARRHLGKVVAGAAMAVTGTAVAVAISLPGQAGVQDRRAPYGQERPAEHHLHDGEEDEQRHRYLL
ncbi:Tat pathway signal sequence domain protein, partial [Streptomyces sp. NPDC002773]